MKHRRLMLTAVLLPLFMTIPVFAGAQFDLVPGQGGDKEHASWKITLEPAKLAPGAHGEIVASYQTTKGWYLYAPEHAASTGMPTSIKISFTGSGAAGAKLDKKLIYPAPKKKVLELFDEPETHLTLEGKGQIRQGFVVPKDAPAGKLEVKVALSYMACSDLLCDPKATLNKNLVAMIDGSAAATEEAAPVKPEVPAAQEKKPAAGIDLGGLLGTAPEGSGGGGKHASFKLELSPTEVKRGGTAELVVRYEMTGSWYIYAPDHISPSDPPLGRPFGLKIPSGQAAADEGELIFPPSQKKNMGDFGAGPEIHSILKNTGEIRQTLRVDKDAAPGQKTLEIELSFMACDEKTGICDPPTTTTHTVEFTVSEETAAVTAPPSPAGPEGEGLLAFILAMIGGGLFALVMPCTYPMIPITISFFTKQAEAREGKVLPLALCYGLGIIVCFNVVGLLVGEIIIRFAQDWPLNLVFGVVFLVFALSFFNLFTIRLPSGLNNLASKASGGTGLLGVFLLGATVVITSFTCTAPVMGGLLAFTATEGGSTGKILLGMSVFGLTMATPFVLLALFPAWTKSMPRSGEWMHTVKVFLGFIELAAALKFFSNADLALFGENFIISRQMFLLAWAVIFLLSGAYLVNMHRGFKGISMMRILSGIAVVTLGIYFFRCGNGAKLDFITAALAPPPATKESGKNVKWTLVKDNFEKGIQKAKAEGKLALINFTGFT